MQSNAKSTIQVKLSGVLGIVPIRSRSSGTNNEKAELISQFCLHVSSYYHLNLAISYSLLPCALRVNDFGPVNDSKRIVISVFSFDTGRISLMLKATIPSTGFGVDTPSSL